MLRHDARMRFNHSSDSIMCAYGSAGERCMAISVAVLCRRRTWADNLIVNCKKEITIDDHWTGLYKQYGIEKRRRSAQSDAQKVRDYFTSGVETRRNLGGGDGRDFAAKPLSNGYFCWNPPDLLDSESRHAYVTDGRIFGPVLVVGFEWTSCMKKGLALINRPRIMVTAPGPFFILYIILYSFYLKKVQVGIVGVNVPIQVPMAFIVFAWLETSALFWSFAMLVVARCVRFYTRMKTIYGPLADRFARGSRVLLWPTK